MRKRFRVLLLAAMVAAVVVPVGFALSPDSLVVSFSSHEPQVATSSMALRAVVATDVRRSIVLNTDRPQRLSLSGELSDRMKLLVLGGVLLGLAAAVRRSG
jgi:hypothetical protein